MTPDEALLDATAQAIRRKLEGSKSSLWSLGSADVGGRTYTRGWYRSIGVARSLGLRAEAWIDHWTGHDRRTLWYGVTTRSEARLKDVSRRAGATLGEALYRDDTDVDEGRFREKLLRREFGLPVLEIYRRTWNYYGVYVLPRSATSRFINGIAESAADLLAKVAGQRELPLDGFPEGAVVERIHLARERNRELVLRAKLRALSEHDCLACEACGFDFGQVYGKLGTDFIEAHHLTPLSSLRSATRTTIDDLVLVCANCHRMLHRHRPWLRRDNLRIFSSRPGRVRDRPANSGLQLAGPDLLPPPSRS